MNDVNPLDPAPGPPIPFRKVGKNGWLLGNKPTRLPAMIVVNDNGEVSVFEIDPVTGDVVDEAA